MIGIGDDLPVFMAQVVQLLGEFAFLPFGRDLLRQLLEVGGGADSVSDVGLAALRSGHGSCTDAFGTAPEGCSYEAVDAMLLRVELEPVMIGVEASSALYVKIEQSEDYVCRAVVY
jgi:hypothetical protein